MNKYESAAPFPYRKKALSLSLNFEEIEAVLGLALPERAYTDTTWWSNDAGHPHAAGWLEAGWRALAVDLGARQVTFEPRHDASFVPGSNRFGCMADTITLVPGVDLSAPSGEVWNAEAGRLLNE
ncbi:MAG: hypothetical protein NT113_13910 [Hyphomicrobiales bacterium]|nr:hypothetical protein [Hyphomicrobiales bacterium]